MSSYIELITVKFHQNKHKQLSLCLYKPPNQKDLVFVEAISAIINEYSSIMNTVIFGDFYMSTESSHLQNLMQTYDLPPLIKELTCFQSRKPTCIDNFLTNQKATFKLIRLLETQFSDHHKLISVVTKSGIFRGLPRKNVYKSYKKFDLDILILH